MDEAAFPVAARGLTVTLGGHRALDGIDLDIEAGARTVVIGPNGAGKSVLLRTLHGLLRPDAGTITWGGSARRTDSQGMVFQRPVMLRRSALANVAYALDVRGIAGDEGRRRALQALERVGLSALAHRQARVLSGGEQQRLALARAWALRPRLLYLDEPTASLDPGAAAEVERIIGDIHAAGTAIVATTHNLGFARRLAQTIVLLWQGRVAERARADEFFDRPASGEAVQFLKGELPWQPASPAS